MSSTPSPLQPYFNGLQTNPYFPATYCIIDRAYGCLKFTTYKSACSDQNRYVEILTQAVDSQEEIDRFRNSLPEKFIIIDLLRGKIYTTFKRAEDPVVFALPTTKEQDYQIKTPHPEKPLTVFLKKAMPDPKGAATPTHLNSLHKPDL